MRRERIQIGRRVGLRARARAQVSRPVRLNYLFMSTNMTGLIHLVQKLGYLGFTVRGWR